MAFETTGGVRWEAVRDGGLNTDEVPRSVIVMPDGTTVVTGPGGPNLPGGYIQGVTAGYGPNGTLLWEAFSRMATVWATALPNGAVCATGGYDALITSWQIPGVGGNQPPTAVISATPSTGPAPLTVTFDGSGSSDPGGAVASGAWSFGDGASGTGPLTTHLYMTPGTYTATLTVTDNAGAIASASVAIKVRRPPRLISAQATIPGTFTFTLEGETNVTYLIQGGYDCKTWTNVLTLPNPDMPAQVTLPISSGNPVRFWRAVMQ